MAIYALSIKHKAKGAGAPAKAHALYIQREGKYKGLGEQKAQSHSAYLTREGKYQVRAQELELTWSGNLPLWAKTGKEFWEAADLYERANGRVYTEAVITLPRELSKEGRREVVEEFISKEIGERFPYTVAIHNPKALDGGEQPHAHVMFSIRELDGIERGRELFFKRANTKCPEKGGAKKSREWSLDERGNDRLNEIRQTWEKLANRALEVEGHEVRIDRRSLEAQGIDREPEPKMGPEVTQKLKRGEETEIGAKVIELRDYRRKEREIKELEVELEQERGKVLQFGERRGVEVQEENVLTFTKSGNADSKVDEKERLRYQRTLDLVLDKRELNDGRVEYVWKRSQRVAFTDHGDKITFNNISETAVKAGLQLAMQKGWGGVKVSGCVEFRRENWIQGQLMGVSVTGYLPDKKDHSLLEDRKREEELKKERSRNRDKLDREKAPEAKVTEPVREIQKGKEEEFWVKASEVLRSLSVEGKELGHELSKLKEERKALGWEEGISFHSAGYKKAISKEQALKQANFDYDGGKLRKLYEEAKKLDERHKEAEGLHTDFEIKQKERGVKKYLPRYRTEGKELSRSVEGARKAYNEIVGSYNQLFKEWEKPEHKQAIEKQANDILKEEESLKERRQEVERRYSKAQAKEHDLFCDRLDLKDLGDTKIRVKKDRSGRYLIADRQEVKEQCRKLQHEQDRGLGKRRGLGR